MLINNSLALTILRDARERIKVYGWYGIDFAIASLKLQVRNLPYIRTTMPNGMETYVQTLNEAKVSTDKVFENAAKQQLEDDESSNLRKITVR